MVISSVKKMNFFQRVMSIFGVSYSKEVMISVIEKVNACSENEINMLNKIADLEKSLGQEGEKLTKVNDMLSKEKNAVKEYKERIESLINKNNSLMAELDKVTTEATVSKEKLKEKKEEIKALSSELKELNKEIINLRKELLAIKEATDELAEDELAPTIKPALDCAKVKAARAAIESGSNITIEAKKLNVSRSTLSRAVNGVTYKHCKDDDL